MNEKLDKLDALLEDYKSILILTHDYPDPDAIASAMLLAYLARKRYRIRTRIAYGGHITRAENRAMLQQLGIKVTPVEKIRWAKYHCIAMVDTQPAFGNHSLPEGLKPVFVIDHHRKENSGVIKLEDIRTEYGACVTMLLEYLDAAGLDLTVDMATAITYAIRSETQDLGRDTSPKDIEAYLRVYPRANKRKLAKLFTPNLPKTYFLLLEKALRKAKVFRHLVHAHLGEVESPEFVAQVADMLLRHERITWALVTGRFEKNLFVSMRSSHANARAGNVLKQIIGKSGSAGGHGMIAGGRINLQENGMWEKAEDRLVVRFLKKFRYNQQAEWKRLLAKEEVAERIAR